MGAMRAAARSMWPARGGVASVSAASWVPMMGRRTTVVENETLALISGLQELCHSSELDRTTVSAYVSQDPGGDLSAASDESDHSNSVMAYHPIPMPIPWVRGPTVLRGGSVKNV